MLAGTSELYLVRGRLVYMYFRIELKKEKKDKSQGRIRLTYLLADEGKLLGAKHISEGSASTM